jgi:hypothetical protein
MAAAVAMFAPGSAEAADLPKSTTATPTGPGAEAPPRARARGVRAIEGYDASVQLGSGFVDTYGLGMGARLGYTFPQGIYVGADVTHYFGNSVTLETGSVAAHATFLGAEGGYKFFPSRHWEVRPYVFAGPAFIRTVQNPPFRSESVTRFAIQPGLLTAYHFGDAFVSAEAKVHVTPDPTALTVFGGAGLGF